MSIKILASADLHLGKKSSAIEEGAEQRSTRYTWQRMVDRAIEHQVDALLLAGDIVDQDNWYFEAIGPLQKGFNRLEQAGVEVFMIAGNHDFDVLGQIIRHHSYEHVHLLGADGSWEKIIYPLKGQDIQFVGWSFTQQHVQEDPLAGFDQLDPDPAALTIGLLHGDLDIPDSLYAPLAFSHLANKSVDAWIMGHIHQPRSVKKEHPLIAYTGTPHALNPGEPGLHGPVLLTVESKHNIQAQWLPLSPIRYEGLEVDVSHTQDPPAFREVVTRGLWESAQRLLPELAEVTYLVYDLQLVGESSHLNKIEAWMQEVTDYRPELSTGTEVSIRKIVSQIQPARADMRDLAGESSPAGKLAQTILVLEQDASNDFLDALTEQWQQYLNKLNYSSTYLPLRQHERLLKGTREEARSIILKESRRLLSMLLAQQKQ